MPESFRVTGKTTFDEFSSWVGRKPAISTIRLRSPQSNKVTPNRGYLALAELFEGQAILGEPSESLVEAVDSMVSNVEELFPD
jgi:hypothetical protein